MTNKSIILCASNATREYLVDVLESLGRPRGDTMHFRYRKLWVDEELWRSLPLKASKSTMPSENRSALIVFVYQETEKNNRINWKFVYPLRFGKIIEWYKTGDDDNDVAYFYFETQNYCSHSSTPIDISNQIIRKMKKQNGWNYSALTELPGVSEIDNSTTPDISAFQSCVNRFDLNHFRSPDKKTKYFPAFTKVSEIRPQAKIKYNSALHRNSVELIEGNDYTVEANIFLKDSPGNESKIDFITSSAYFENPSKVSENVGSRYDEFVWQIIPSKLKNNILIPIQLSTDIKPKQEDYHVLNLEISIPLLLKFDWRLRVAEIVGDVLPVFATTLLVSIGLLQKIDAYKDWWSWMFGVAVIAAVTGLIIKARTFWLGRNK